MRAPLGTRPWAGIEPATPWFTGWHSIHWATPARANLSFKIWLTSKNINWELNMHKDILESLLISSNYSRSPIHSYIRKRTGVLNWKPSPFSHKVNNRADGTGIREVWVFYIFFFLRITTEKISGSGHVLSIQLWLNLKQTLRWKMSESSAPPKVASTTYFNLKKFSSALTVIGCDYWSMNMHKATVLEEKEKPFFSVYLHMK